MQLKNRKWFNLILNQNKYKKKKTKKIKNKKKNLKSFIFLFVHNIKVGGRGKLSTKNQLLLLAII